MLRSFDGVEHRSRVEDVDGERLVLARPMNLATGEGFAQGDLMDVIWSDPTGLTVLNAELTETRAQGPVGLWVVQPVGEPWREQRRRFVRVPVTGLVRVVPVAPDQYGFAVASFAARFVDVSEAALRCAVAASDARALSVGSVLVLVFTVDTEVFELMASVISLARSRRYEDTVDLVAAFEVTEERAMTLRRLVFEQQIRIRNGVKGV